MLTVQGDGEVAASVGNAVQTKVIGHVSDTIFFICFLRDDGHRTWLCIFLGEGIAGFGEAPVQYLHQTMRVAVIMDGASFARRPYEDQLQKTRQLHALQGHRAHDLFST